MRRGGTTGIVFLAAALAGLGACGPKGPKVPAREVVTPLLQKEATVLKEGGEQFDPALGMKATWTVQGIDVTERPNDSERPWAGAIRFRIRSEMRDEQGAVVAKESERRFDYLWSTSLSRWIYQLPPSPAPGR
jgi:predicted small lipoprotein YifL